MHWQDMANKGYLDKETMKKEWIVTPDDRLCKICAPLKGEKVGIDDAFSWGGKRPTRHPRCRCAFGLVEVLPVKPGTTELEDEGDYTEFDALDLIAQFGGRTRNNG
jgi:hypothetical protein